MSEPSKDELIFYRISRAKETLNEVEVMIQNCYWNAAINRLYYSCFYSVIAILLKHDIKAQTHSGVRQMFGLHFVHTGKISKELGKFYADLFDKRQTGDYDDFISYDEETLSELLPLGVKLVNEIEILLNQN